MSLVWVQYSSRQLRLRTLVVRFASRTLHQHKKNYSTIKKEMLAIVWAIDHLRCYLYETIFAEDRSSTAGLVEEYEGAF